MLTLRFTRKHSIRNCHCLVFRKRRSFHQKYSIRTPSTEILRNVSSVVVGVEISIFAFNMESNYNISVSDDHLPFQISDERSTIDHQVTIDSRVATTIAKMRFLSRDGCRLMYTCTTRVVFDIDQILMEF